jgi:hypothetical protein
MPSPFPGMDPFIEGQQWRDFHLEMISAIRALLAPSVVPRYIVGVEEDVYFIPSPEGNGRLPRPQQIIPDAFVGAAEGASGRLSAGGTATLVAVPPVTLTLPSLIDRRQAYLAVRYRETREVVTVIELLSPTNKGPTGGRGLPMAAGAPAAGRPNPAGGRGSRRVAQPAGVIRDGL